MVIRSHEYENLFFLISLLFIFKMLVGGENVFMTNPHIKICTHNTNYVLLLENTVVEHQRIRAMVFNATFSNISIISWQSALLMEETELPKETHWPAASYISNLITWCCIEYTPPWVGFKLTTLFFILLWCGSRFYWWKIPEFWEENHRPDASQWQTFVTQSLNVVSSTPLHE